jgi:signal peptidase II
MSQGITVVSTGRHHAGVLSSMKRLLGVVATVKLKLYLFRPIMIDTARIKENFQIDSRFTKYLWIILIALLVDHLIKLLVYHNLHLHEEIKIIGGWFRIRLELNDGMAFSNLFENETDRYLKILIKFFTSLVLLLCLIYFINKQGFKSLLVGLALCFAGNIGNFIDRVFYGVLINNALDKYSMKWFHGRIIDMFYFPLFEVKLPNWFPVIGGKDFLFFEPVFNFSDLILVIGAIMTIVGLIKMNILNKLNTRLLRQEKNKPV